MSSYTLCEKEPFRDETATKFHRDGKCIIYLKHLEIGVARSEKMNLELDFMELKGVLGHTYI